MTDLKQVTAITIDPEASIDHAMRVMVRRNVRLLLVVNIDNEIVGLITATDLLGEKPVQHVHEHGGTRDDIQVRDLMTPHERLEVIDSKRCVTAQSPPAPWSSTPKPTTPRVRGIFSVWLARQLGGPCRPARWCTFAEIRRRWRGRRPGRSGASVPPGDLFRLGNKLLHPGRGTK
jgi:hypothetical protein